MTAAEILQLIFQIGQLIIKYGPNVIADAENVWGNLQLAYQSATSGTPLTAEQQAKVDASLDAANKALQDAATAEQNQV